MGRMKELSMILEDSIEVVTDVITAADMLSAAAKKSLLVISAVWELFSIPNDLETAEDELEPLKKAAPAKKKEPVKAVEAEVSAEPTEKTYTKEEVRKFLAGVSNSGHRDDVKALLVKYGADNLTQLDPTHYADIVADAEAIKNG